jgi:hypothetical protein
MTGQLHKLEATATTLKEPAIIQPHPTRSNACRLLRPRWVRVVGVWSMSVGFLLLISCGPLALTLAGWYDTSLALDGLVSSMSIKAAITQRPALVVVPCTGKATLRSSAGAPARHAAVGPSAPNPQHCGAARPAIPAVLGSVRQTVCCCCGQGRMQTLSLCDDCCRHIAVG